MAKPIFALDGWKVPSQIAPEVKKSVPIVEKKKNAVPKIDAIEVTNKLFQTPASKSENNTHVSNQNEKKNTQVLLTKRKPDNTPSKTKPKKKQKKVEATSILNLDVPVSEDAKSTSENEKNKSSQNKEVSNLPPSLQKMQKKLQGSQFRIINEMLYTMSGDKAFEKFQSEPEMFDIYHTGFRSQVESWPSNPVDGFINYLENSQNKKLVVADMGCGEAELALKAPKSMTIHSFDLVKANSRITPCDIAHTPLSNNQCDVVIFSLSLMGTNYTDFISEANRILKPGGELKIAEVISRFEDLEAFIQYMTALNFNLIRRDESNKMFVLLDFVKNTSVSKKLKKAKKFNGLPQAPSLKPCIYKRR